MRRSVSVLFNESKLLKRALQRCCGAHAHRFSTLQRVEIAEIVQQRRQRIAPERFSTLQRVEIAETTSIRPRAP